MRIINLIVVHCSATRGDCTLSPEDLDRLHRRRGFNGTGITTTSARMEQCTSPAPSNASEHMQKVSTLTQ